MYVTWRPTVRITSSVGCTIITLVVPPQPIVAVAVSINPKKGHELANYPAVVFVDIVVHVLDGSLFTDLYLKIQKAILSW